MNKLPDGQPHFICSGGAPLAYIARYCGLGTLPDQTAMLAGLREIDLTGNRFTAHSLPLEKLPALRRLATNWRPCLLPLVYR